jgi:hypothetical protein
MLLDHFRPPIGQRRSWEGFHGLWAAALVGQERPFLLDSSVAIYAVAYRPSREWSGDQIELWPRPLRLGEPLPTLPLALRNAETVPVDLEQTYHEACLRSRLLE